MAVRYNFWPDTKIIKKTHRFYDAIVEAYRDVTTRFMNPNQKESSVSCDSVPCCFHNPPLKLNSERTWKFLGLIQFLFEFFTILEGKKRPNHSSYLPLANGHVRDGNSWNLEITHSFRPQPFSRGWSCTKETKLKGGCHAVKGMGGWSTSRFNRDTVDSKPASLPEHLQAIELVVHKIPHPLWNTS